jgi:Escherichia/Staphylococcus phage prohead protease
MTNTKELRYLTTQELRAAGTTAAPRIEGYAATFSQIADLGTFKETIQKGAFTRTLASDTEIVCLFNHDDSLLLGRRSAGTLTLEQDEIGLKFSCLLPDTSVARDTYANLKAGNLRECSFGFFADGEQWTKLPDGTPLRTLTSVKLFDVSVVSFPAYQGTSAIARNVVPTDLEKRMASARGASTEHLGVVPFAASNLRSEDPYNSVDEANGIINWADGEDEDRADAPVNNKLKASQGFAYVANDGSKRSDYLLPHHTVRDGQIAHSYMGTLSALGDLATPGKVDIPDQYRAEVRSHLLSEMDIFNNDSDSTEEVQRSRARIRLALSQCVRQLDLAPFDLLFWLHPLVNHHSAPGRSEALRRP